jgi:tripartite-type tricarboxylate transporter receptor subunit TctC
VRWIVPSATGGGYDTLSRLIEPFYEEALGLDIRIENIPGAATLVGAQALARAEADGRTVGVLNAPALLTMGMTSKENVPDLLEDFSILARVMGSEQVLATAGGSPLRSIEDVLAEAERRPVLCGLTEVGGTNFVSIATTQRLLALDLEYVSGYQSSAQVTLAALRGEVDLVCGTFSSRLDSIEQGDLRPVLQLTSAPISDHSSLEGVPLLGGPTGLAARRAETLGRDADQAVALAQALERVCRMGRVVAAPGGLSSEAYDRLEGGLSRALSDLDFQRSAARIGYPVRPVRGDRARAELRNAVSGARRLAPVVNAALERVRNR